MIDKSLIGMTRALVVAQLVDKVASDTRDWRFESSPGQFLFTVNSFEKTKNKDKEAENGFT